MNLGEGRTVFGCANRLLVAVGGLSRTGRVGLDGVMDGFWARVLEWRSGQRKFLLVVLDEADRPFMDERGDPSGFLYRFVHSQDRLEGSGISLSLLTISNSPI